MIASKQLAGRVDAIYCPTDNTIISALESVIKVGIDAQMSKFLPVIQIRLNVAPLPRLAITIWRWGGKQVKSWCAY